MTWVIVFLYSSFIHFPLRITETRRKKGETLEIHTIKRRSVNLFIRVKFIYI